MHPLFKTATHLGLACALALALPGCDDDDDGGGSGVTPDAGGGSGGSPAPSEPTLGECLRDCPEAGTTTECRTSCTSSGICATGECHEVPAECPSCTACRERCQARFSPPEDVVGGECTVSGEAGTCLDVADCAAQGDDSTPGFCPGPTEIQCCTPGAPSNCVGEGGALTTGNPGPGNPLPSCCPALQTVPTVCPGERVPSGVTGYCVDCGNGTCDDHERPCNCPEDGPG